MTNPAPRFNLERLADLTGVPGRTIRFWIQMEVVPRPHGSRRGAWYDENHLARVGKVKKLSEKGLSLAAIRAALAPETKSEGESAPAPGTVSVKTHVAIAPGLELVIDPMRLPFSQAALRRLAAAILEDAKAAERWDRAESEDAGARETNGK